ncbi:helix-turn-helix domain-containing protein [Lactococcus kimchii]|uniref:helix-turn-helix domain-containing protein n=1 Tax=Lactococcus sp. S-13 TaxID=2507158 RepID=UPI0010232135|nr:helix-turn-helix domain-containing protein [Lactococcus sp. S-13]RZI49424.1 helix-turn-helix domain-containing protein [Lactococcus sp. S-13]
MLGENLQKARLAQNLTQEEVAKELYFSRQAISRWEAGKTEPNLETLISLAQIYDTDLTALTEGIQPQKRKKHLNLFAGFGILLFNFVLGVWLIVAIVLVLAAVYMVLLALLLAPFLMIFATATHNPSITFINATGATGFDWWYWLLGIVGCSLTILGLPYIWKFTKLLYFWLIKYLKFNLKAVYN